MATINELPDLSRTVQALAVFDALDLTVDGSMNAEVLAQLAAIEVAEGAVGYAFGLDTADRNSLEDCRKLVRPGPAVPSPGAELSYVRRMVALHIERTIKVVEADRPDTKAGEQAAMCAAFHAALTECCDILELPGSPSLCNIPNVLRRLKVEGRLHP